MLSIISTLVTFVVLFCRLATIKALKATVFGATGGVGQLICKQLLQDGYDVSAVSRDVKAAASFGNLKGCELLSADARIPETLPPTLRKSDVVVISVGTTAFPTIKWYNGNDPKAACVDTVQNICDALDKEISKPRAVVLVSSIGVERRNMPPFSILNLFGVLDAKIESENIVEKWAKKSKLSSIIVRPGRLVGAPFTNFDLAKLFNITQGDNKGIRVSRLDDLSGDMDREDVATAISEVLKMKIDRQSVKFSIINQRGSTPVWNELLANII